MESQKNNSGTSCATHSRSIRDLRRASCGPCYSYDAFHQLLALHGLETSVLNVRDFNDETLIKWASASANFKNFKALVTSVKNLITLGGVKTLLQRCRDLKKLSLCFDASELDLIPKIPPTPSPRHGLKGWDIAVSLVTPDALGPVIAILSWVFLDIRDVKSCNDQMKLKLSEVLVLPHTLKRKESTWDTVV